MKTKRVYAITIKTVTNGYTLEYDVFQDSRAWMKVARTIKEVNEMVGDLLTKGVTLRK